MINTEVTTITQIKQFDYSNDRLIIADMDNREKSYIFLLASKINELVDLLNAEVGKRKNLERTLSAKIEAAEKQAAKEIKDSK